MTPYPRISNKLIKTGVGCPSWRFLSSTTKWTLLDMWDQADEALFLEMAETQPELKARPNFAKANPHMKKISDDRRKARKAERAKGRESASYGREK